MSNFSAEIFLWTILQLWFNKNIWNYSIHQKEFVRLTVNKKIDTFEIFNYWNTQYLFLLYSVGILVFWTLNTLSPVFLGFNNNNLFWNTTLFKIDRKMASSKQICWIQPYPSVFISWSVSPFFQDWHIIFCYFLCKGRVQYLFQGDGAFLGGGGGGWYFVLNGVNWAFLGCKATSLNFSGNVFRRFSWNCTRWQALMSG